MKLFKEYILATRPWSLPASVTPALLANILAFKQLDSGMFSMSTAIGSMICIIGVHLAGNLVNTYHDFVNDIDGPSSDDKTLVDGVLKPNDVYGFSMISYIVASATCLVFAVTTNNDVKPIFYLFSVGALLSYFYTSVLKLKYIALGDVAVILTFGPINVLFTYAVQTNVLSWKPVLASLPLVCLTEGILHANNSRDLKKDTRKNILTVSILLGKSCAFYFYTILLLTPFVCALYMGVVYCKIFAIELVLLPMAVSLIKRFYFDNFHELPQKTAALNLLYGMLYTIGFVYC